MVLLVTCVRWWLVGSKCPQWDGLDTPAIVLPVANTKLIDETALLMGRDAGDGLSGLKPCGSQLFSHTAQEFLGGGVRSLNLMFVLVLPAE